MVRSEVFARIFGIGILNGESGIVGVGYGDSPIGEKLVSLGLVRGVEDRIFGISLCLPVLPGQLAKLVDCLCLVGLQKPLLIVGHIIYAANAFVSKSIGNSLILDSRGESVLEIDCATIVIFDIFKLAFLGGNLEDPSVAGEHLIPY